MLTKKQKEILDFIKKYIKKNGYSPTIEEIAEYFDRSVGTIHEHLEVLKEKGVLEKQDNQPRAINIQDAEPMVYVPLLGTIAAGEPLEALQEKETIAVSKTKLPQHGDIYALKVVGNSMIDENINDGDIILVKRQETAKNGQKIVALVDNNEATLKTFYKERNHIRLQPANKKIEPIILDKDIPLSIQGIFLDVIKRKNQPDLDEQKKQKENTEKNSQQQTLLTKKIKITSKPTKDSDVVLFHGDRLDLFKLIPKKSVRLIVTSPPYNIGKEYEKRKDLDVYLKEQEETIKQAIKILADDGSICWQVGNHIGKDGEVFPLDALIYQIGKKLGLKLRNRIIWHFGHGLHCTKRFSGRHETILWFTKTDDYIFNLDPIRVPQKYPGKTSYKKNGNYGKLSGNPLGKNPSDIWEIPNVKSNHPEKTQHPCQFPIELIERLVLSMTNKGDVVLDPYTGVGSALCAAVIHDRKAYGSDIMKEYLDIAKERIKAAVNGTLKRRLMGTQIHQLKKDSKLAKLPDEFLKVREGLFGSR